MKMREIIGTSFEVRMSVLLATIADGAVLTAYPLRDKGDLIAAEVVVTKAVTTASKLSTLTVTRARSGLSTTPTLATFALTSAALTPLGTVVNGTLATSRDALRVLEDDTVTITASSTTAFVEGSIDIILTFRRRA